MTLAQAMNASAATVPAEVDEFTLSGVTARDGQMVDAPRVAESPVSFECRLTQLIRLETKEGRELDQWLVIGEAVGIHIAADLIENGIYQTARARPILRGGGPVDYFEVTEAARFEMRRPDS